MTMRARFSERRGEYEIATDPARLDRALIHAFLSEHAYWSIGVPRAVVDRAIEHSLCFGLYRAGGQVGFARVVTDRATFAYLGDVFVLPEARGQGLSKWLVDAILRHPELQGLRRWLLATRDAHGLYARFGFAPPAVAGRLMERHDPDVYLRAPKADAASAESRRR
jgi:GNAT superfamily N-acetyltransferase